MRKALLAILIVFSLTPTYSVSQRIPIQRNRNVILIGWDAAGRDRVKECLEQGELPNLSMLCAEGSIVAIDILRTTDTRAGWAQILTGYEPETTGVFSNDRYGEIPAGLTIFERLEDHFGRDNFVTAAIIQKKKNMEAEPGKPYFNAQVQMDAFINGIPLDRTVALTTLELLDLYKNQQFFFFVHFGGVDDYGHVHGEDSKEYRDLIIKCDVRLGEIVNKLIELGLYHRTLIYVTADHGFDKGQKSHDDAPYVFLATNDPLVRRRGERMDIAPTILSRFGLDLKKIYPPLDGQSLTRPLIRRIW